MEISTLYQIFKEYPKITTDSRNVAENSIYFALKGDKFDGNTFAIETLNKGAKYAIIDDPKYYLDSRTILVENTLRTLQNLANFHRRKLSIPFIAITGSNGKTTTKELIRCVLSEKYKVYATQGNLNNHIGVPLTILSITSDIEMAIIEMGANHPLEIKELCNIAEPDFGIITNIGRAHLEGFGGFEGVIKTKKELYDFLMAENRTVFYNSDNQILSELLTAYENKISYGNGQTSGRCRGSIIDKSVYLTTEIEDLQQIGSESKINVSTNLLGDYNFENVLAAACIGMHFNIPMLNIKNAIESYVPTNNRSQLKITDKNKLILDCYNANPSSTEAAVLNFAKINEQHKVIILGDMLELGNIAETEHLKILELLKKQTDVKVILVGKIYKSVAQSYEFSAFLDVDELNNWLQLNPMQQSFVLIKGSRGIQLEKIVPVL